MNKILVLGSNGLIGKCLVEYLLTKSYKIGALSKNEPKMINPKIFYYSLDIINNYKMLSTIVSKYDIVINLIGQITNPINECIRLNTFGINNIIKAVKENKKKLFHISSLLVYGTQEDISEETSAFPETEYGILKHFADSLIIDNLQEFAILRISNIFDENHKKGIFAYLSKQYYLNQKDIFFNNNGELSRFYLSLSDLIIIIEKLIKKNYTGILNISGEKAYSIKDLINKFDELLSYKFNVKYYDSFPKENIKKINRDKMIKLSDNLQLKSVDSFIKGLK